MGKVTRTVYLDEEDVEMAKLKGYVISEICRQAIAVAAWGNLEDAELGQRVSMINNELYSLDKDVIATNKHSIYLENKHNNLNYEKKELIETQARIEKQNKISKLMQSLNKAIVANSFNVEAIKIQCHELIDRITELNEKFDIEVHIERLKVVFDF